MVAAGGLCVAGGRRKFAKFDAVRRGLENAELMEVAESVVVKNGPARASFHGGCGGARSWDSGTITGWCTSVGRGS